MNLLSPVSQRSILRAVLLTTTIVSFTAQAASPFTTEGKFSVGSDGSANYSIPIVVPPGTAGMQPQLALNYNSNGGNGIVGMGWGIDGLSQISRCGTTLEQDGVINGVTYTAKDRFCIDGQRLIATTDSYVTNPADSTKKIYITTSAYGANGTEYRTESANFAKVISYGTAGTGPAYFKVWTKSGQIIEYGNTADSAIEAQGKPTIRTWGVNKISDTKGNYITVSYTEDNANGEAYVSSVDYTGNANSTPALTPYANVQFIYEARPDTTIGYQAGSVLKTTKRLTNIQTFNGTTQVKSYKLAYEQSQATNRSRLKSMQECDGNTTTLNCKQSVNFTWTFGNAGWTSNLNLVLPEVLAADKIPELGTQLIDINGDGLPDLVRGRYTKSNVSDKRTWLNTGSGWVESSAYALPEVLAADTIPELGTRLIDINGDGLPDLVRGRYTESNVSDKRTWLNNGYVEILISISLAPFQVSNIQYFSLTSAQLYQKDSIGMSDAGYTCLLPRGEDLQTNSYPIQNLQAPIYVVSTTGTTDGNGGIVKTNYQYGGLKAHLRGRGSLGFRYVKESSPDSGLSVTNFYRQDFPFIGLPCQVEKRRLSDNALLSVVQNTYANTDLATSTMISKFPYLSQSVEQAYELDGPRDTPITTTTTTNQYDGYGNVTSVSVDDGLGNTKTTTSTYNNDIGNWLLGRLIRSTVTSTTP